MSNEVPALAKAFPPGYFIREELEDRGWSQRRLASEMQRPVQTVSEIINGRKRITAETAMQLQAVFGTSATYWMNLDAIWQLYEFNRKKTLAERREKNRAVQRDEAHSAARKSVAVAKNRSYIAPEPIMTEHRMAAKAQMPGALLPPLRPRQRRSPRLASRLQIETNENP